METNPYRLIHLLVFAWFSHSLCLSQPLTPGRVSKAKAIEVAKRFVGTYEVGYNEGKVIEALIKKHGYSKHAAYCGIFVGNAYQEAGIQPPKSYAIANEWYRQRIEEVIRLGIRKTKSHIVPGDIVCFSFYGSKITHVELILEFNELSDYFFTIGANTSDPINPKRQGIFIKRRRKSECFIIKTIKD